MLDIYIDSREQKKLEFNGKYVDNVIVHKLPYGDYACKVDGVKCPVYFERKSLPDLFGTMGKGFKRFKKEINRSLEADDTLIIIVEEPLVSIREGFERSQMSGIGIVRTLFTLMIKHNIPFVTCYSRDEMSLYIQEFFYSWAKNKGGR